MKTLIDPKKIETRSFEIIDKRLAGVKLPGYQKEVLKRVLHATSDFNYINDIIFHSKAIGNALLAIKKGKNIIVDSSMVKAGINKKLLSDFGLKVICLINKKDVALAASRLNITRSIVAMRKAGRLMEGGIVAIGNAPTALFEICDLISSGKAYPSVVIGLPVGFVGAKEAKEKLRVLKVPYITNRSRYGGSSLASSCVNALLKIALREKICAE